MDIERLKEFKEALNFIQKSEASTIRVSNEFFDWINIVGRAHTNLVRGVSSKLICDTSLKGLVIHECNAGTDEYVNLGTEDSVVDIASGNHD